MILSSLVFTLAASSATEGPPLQFWFRNNVPGNGRQVFEMRFGSTSRPTSTQTSRGLLLTLLTAGPTPGTTSVLGAQIDGGTIFNGGPNPSFTTVIASGSAFSLGGGCERGNVTDFPLINANRPQIIRFNAANGQWTLQPFATGNNDNYDSIDCDASDQGTIFATTNRTQNRLELFRDNGGGVQPLQTSGIGGVATPFAGGLRPAIGSPRTVADASIVLSRLTGVVDLVPVNRTTGAVGTPCPIGTGPAPTGFTRPRETALLTTPGFRYVFGDFDENGTTDISQTPLGSCTPFSTVAPPGSSNGGNGYNWTGYGAAVAAPDGAANILWGDWFYVDPENDFVQDASLVSPFAGRGGPFSNCNVRDSNLGSSWLAAGVSSPNTSTFDLVSPRAFPNLNETGTIFRGEFETPAVLDTAAFATCP